MGDESRSLELEKLQRLVQSLQKENEQLVAAAGSKSTQNGNNKQRRAPTATDLPRDSGIDLSASTSDDLDDDIIDLDRFDLHDDEESWLYSTPAAKKQGDIVSWLRKDINSLNPAARRALAVKLEMLIAKKNSNASKTTMDSNCSKVDLGAAQDDVCAQPFIAGIIDFDEDGILSSSGESDEKYSSPVDARRVVTRRTTFRVDRGSTAAGSANAATFTRPKKTEQAAKGTVEGMASGSMTKQQQSPALSVADESSGAGRSAAASPGLKSTLETIHLELNPDIHDIQLLASLQEEELRRCLQSLQEMNRRRRTSSGNQKEAEASSVTSQSSGASVGATAAPSKSSDRYATYTRPKQQLVASNAGGAQAAAVASRKTPTPQNGQSQDSGDISNQTVAGLQKSLPNLSGSKSEFNLPAPAFPVDTASEKGSYGDIPNALNQPNRTQAATSSASRLTPMGSRLPTPARSRLPTPAKTGIPLPRSSTSLATPTATGQRAKSPASKSGSLNVSRTPSAKDGWNEGCF